jgi:hypothetical protein
MFKKNSAAVAPALVEKPSAAADRSPQNKIYWPGALLGIAAGAAYPVYYVGRLVLDAHPGQQAWSVLIDQGFIYLVVAAGIVPAYIGAKVFELLLGSVFQNYKR